MRVNQVSRGLHRGVGAKDIILALIAQLRGGRRRSGHVIEYAGDAISALDMEARMTICNMSIEAGARAGMIAPDDVTFQYLSAYRAGRPRGRHGEEALVRSGGPLPAMKGARFDREVTLDASACAA